MAEKGFDGPSLAALAAGSIFIYGGIKGFSVVKGFQNVLKGESPSTGQKENFPLLGGSNTTSTTSFSGGGSPSANKALAQQMAAERGWTGAQWTALDALWGRESGFNNEAENSSSGAYGIAQALPPTKMPFAGQKAGGSDPATQIQWGLDYIAETYNDPVTAEAHEQANGWY